MKTHRLLAAGLSLAITMVAAEQPVQPSALVPPAKSSEKKPVYELPTTGKNIPRPGGSWLNVEAVGTRLVIKFFDAEKRPVPPDVDRGFARFRYTARTDKHAVLNREGDALVTPARVRPPHNFLVLLSLFAGASAEAAEFHTFDYP